MTQQYHILNRIYENVVTGKRSELLFEACQGLDAVTLNPNFVCDSHVWKSDPFFEVRTVNPETVPRLQGVNPTPSNLDDLIDAICSAIAMIWEPERPHVVFHSSGHDSRVLSSCIRKLWRERGDDWLGDVLFLSNRWEADTFCEIMRLQGWRSDQYAAYDAGPVNEHYGRVLDFDRFWYINNAPVPLPGRFFGYLVDWARDIELIPDGVQLQAFNGHGCALDGRRREGVWRLRDGVETTARRIWEHGSMNFHSVMMLDYPGNLHANFILAEKRVVDTALGWDTDESMRVAIANRLCPEISHLPNESSNDHHALIARYIREECEKRFADSEYAKITGKTWECPPRASIEQAWATWGLASLCEHLHRQGVEVHL